MRWPQDGGAGGKGAKSPGKASKTGRRFRTGNQLHWQVEVDGLARAQLLWGPAHAAEHIPPPPPGTRIVLTPLIDAASRPKLTLEQPAKVCGAEQS